MFPFLIGTVRTRYVVKTVPFARGFPFLIGTVRTILFLQVVSGEICVSIPHRYGKNQKLLELLKHANACFHSS